MASNDEGAIGCLVVIGLLLWGGYAGWDYLKTGQKQKNSCPASVPGYPYWNASGISFGTGKHHPMEATIISVAAECIPPDAPGEKTDSHSYSVAITANVTYHGTNDWFDGPNPVQTVIFECNTKNQIVLGSKESTFNFVRGGTEGTVSAKITGLSAEEVGRIEFAYVRWKYGS